MKSVAFIGSAGVPNRYGGFESFLEACTPIFAKNRRTIVTCDAGRYDDFSPTWSGVERRFISIGANGATSIIHDLVAFFRVYRDADAIVVLGVSAGVFMPIFRILCAIGGVRLIVNIDGIEWRRNKFSRTKKAYLWLSDKLSQRFAHSVVVDSKALKPFLSAMGLNKAAYIPYSGDQILRLKNKKEGNYLLTICRIEPENNCELLIDGFLCSERSDYIFVGNWSNSEYGQSLKNKYRDVSGLRMVEAVYDKETVADLRENASAYLHGHSVGGTNPSLVEMLYYDVPIYAFDCAFNVETAGHAAKYFGDADSLAFALREDPTYDAERRRVARARYTRQTIVEQYVELIDGR